ncbi:MAG: hypothetical protein Q8N56_04340 [bacterium]|nr:hypothetical protein [bacterium]
MKKRNLLKVGLLIGLAIILIEFTLALVFLGHPEWDWLRLWVIPGTTVSEIILFFWAMLGKLK